MVHNLAERLFRLVLIRFHRIYVYGTEFKCLRWCRAYRIGREVLSLESLQNATMYVLSTKNQNDRQSTLNAHYCGELRAQLAGVRWQVAASGETAREARDSGGGDWWRRGEESIGSSIGVRVGRVRAHKWAMANGQWPMAADGKCGAYVHTCIRAYVHHAMAVRRWVASVSEDADGGNNRD